MKDLIDKIYEQGFTDRTIRSLLMVIYDERPKEADIIFKNIKTEEMANIKQKMKIVNPYLDRKLAKGCDGCPDEVTPDPDLMAKIIIPSEKNQLEAKDQITGEVGEILNRYESDKEKMIEYARGKGYPVRMNYTPLKIAQIIAENEQ